MKKIFLALIVLALASGAAGYYYYARHIHTKTVSQTPAVPVKSAPEPVSTKAVTVPSPTVTSGFVVGIIAVSKSVNAEVISYELTNDGDTMLTSMPDTQFRLFGTTGKTSRFPIPEKTSADLKGQLAVNAKRKGSITFDTFVSEPSELRFYPDPAAETFIVVPLIPLPENQQ